MLTDFEKKRSNYKPLLIDAFKHYTSNISVKEFDDGIVQFRSGLDFYFASKKIRNILVAFSGELQPGFHNCVAGIYHAIVKYSPHSKLYGAMYGIKGILKSDIKLLNSNIIKKFMNRGGCDMLGTSVANINNDSDYDKIIQECKIRDIDVIVMVGGDDLNLNFLLLNDYIESNSNDISVVSIPRVVGGDSPNVSMKLPLGQDTIVRGYSQLISNIQMECISRKKEYDFISLSGSSISQIMLDCAMNCHPTLTIIPDEIRQKQLSFMNVVDSIVDCIKSRKADGRNYGVIVLPNNLFDYIFDIKNLIREINLIVSKRGNVSILNISEYLGNEALNTFLTIPIKYRANLFFGIGDEVKECVDIIAQCVSDKLKDTYFEYKKHHLSSESLGNFPTNFDCTFGYNLGICAFLLGLARKTGYVAYMDSIEKNVKGWSASGIPVSMLMVEEVKNGKINKIMKKHSIDITSPLFAQFRNRRSSYMLLDEFAYAGSIDYSYNNFSLPISVMLTNSPEHIKIDKYL